MSHLVDGCLNFNNALRNLLLKTSSEGHFCLHPLASGVMSIVTCLRSPLLFPKGKTIPTVPLVAHLGDRGGGEMRQIRYDMTLVPLNSFKVHAAINLIFC